MPDRHGPYRNYRFILYLGGGIKAKFSQATIPETTSEPIEFRWSTDPPTMRKLAGMVTFGNLTLQTGVTEDSLELFYWRQMVERGAVDEARRKRISVTLMDEGGEPAARWHFENAWPTKYDAPDLDASANEVAIETLEIAHEGMWRE